MKTDVSSVAVAVFCGCLLLGGCIFNAAQAIKSGLDSVANSLDRVTRSIK